MHQFLHFGIRENVFTITQNALILELLGGGFAPRPPSRSSPPCIPAGGTDPLRLPLAPSSGSAIDASRIFQVYQLKPK